MQYRVLDVVIKSIVSNSVQENQSYYQLNREKLTEAGRQTTKLELIFSLPHLIPRAISIDSLLLYSRCSWHVHQTV